MSYRTARPSHHLCGCYYQDALRKQYLPQINIESHTTILRATSETTLEQTFANPSKDTISECIYTFPLYDGGSIVSFDCYVGERKLRGVVEEKRKAKATYDKAVARGETAGLLEQLP